MRPINDYILIIPEPEEDSGDGVIMPDSAKFLQRGKVIDTGPDSCIMHFMEGNMTANVISKMEIAPGLEPGAHVLYRKVSEQRMTMDQGYRVKMQHEGKEVFALIIKISDIIAIV